MVDKKICPVCNYFLIDIISWDQPIRFCQKCNWQLEIEEKLYNAKKLRINHG
jgi:hypothetical protein